MKRPKYKQLYCKAISDLKYAELQLKIYEYHFGKLTESHSKEYQIHRMEADINAPSYFQKLMK